MEFRKINKSNYLDCITLEVNDNQKDYVADKNKH